MYVGDDGFVSPTEYRLQMTELRHNAPPYEKMALKYEGLPVALTLPNILTKGYVSQ